eukprot:549862-Amorphochlora_amoeboformis.AAC.1
MFQNPSPLRISLWTLFVFASSFLAIYNSSKASPLPSSLLNSNALRLLSLFARSLARSLAAFYHAKIQDHFRYTLALSLLTHSHPAITVCLSPTFTSLSFPLALSHTLSIALAGSLLLFDLRFGHSS